VLTKDDLEKFQQQLRDVERAVLEEMRLNAGSTEPPSLDEAIGRLTRMDALQQQQMALHARRRLDVRLARVRGALARLAEGTFGHCALCRGEVPRARLEAAPETPFCVACQEELDRSGRT
jgi:DnaK suppressor protein